MAESPSNGHTLDIPAGGWRLIMNQLVSRLGLASRLGWQFEGKRPLHEILGYKAELQYRDFKALYCRGDIAHRLVNAYPEDTWAKRPQVKEDADEHADTPFETAWLALEQRLGLYSVMRHADLLANLGRYSVILVGLRGQSQLGLPASPVRSPEDILYMQVYSEEFAAIKTWVTDPGDARFGKPQTYSIATGGTTLGDLGTSPSATVHASRVIHIVGERLLDDEYAAIPLLETVFDRLTDLAKVVWSSAEMFYRSGQGRLGLELKDGFVLSPEHKTAFEEETEKYMLGMKSVLNLAGFVPHQLQGSVVSPKDHAAVLVDMVCAALPIPRRKLMGSERGELASSQDEEDWQRAIARRQDGYAAPRIAQPVIQWTIDYGGLPQPAQFLASWAESPMSPANQAAYAKDIATALDTYSRGQAQAIISPETFLEKAVAWPPDLALEQPDLRPEEGLPLPAATGGAADGAPPAAEAA